MSASSVLPDHIDAGRDGAGVCDGGRDGAGVCLLLLVVDAISGRAAALAAEPLLHASFLSCCATPSSCQPSGPGQRMPLQPSDQAP